jgi:hypothetical protein
MALVEDYGNFGSSFDFGCFEPDIRQVFDYSGDVCAGLNFHDVSEPALWKDLGDFTESFNAPKNLEDFETSDFAQDFSAFDEYKSVELVEPVQSEQASQYEEEIPSPMEREPVLPTGESIQDMVMRIVNSLEKKKTKKAVVEKPEITRKRKVPQVIRAPRKDSCPRKSLALPVQSSGCSRFWSSMPSSESIRIYPTIIPSEGFEKMLKSGEIRQTDVGLRYKLARAYGEHFPNQWLLRTLLKSVFPDFHKARGTLINKPSTVSTPWPPLQPGSTLGLSENSLLLAQFGNDWYFMVWKQFQSRCSQCPMKALGHPCPNSQHCPGFHC